MKLVERTCSRSALAPIPLRPIASTHVPAAFCSAPVRIGAGRDDSQTSPLVVYFLRGAGDSSEARSTRSRSAKNREPVPPGLAFTVQGDQPRKRDGAASYSDRWRKAKTERTSSEAHADKSKGDNARA